MNGEQYQRWIPLIGRVLLSTIFIFSALGKIGNWSDTAAQMESQGMPLVPLFLVGAIVFELGGGLSVLLGYRARIGALVLLIFLAPTTAIFHNPIGLEDQQQQMQLIHLLKNLAIAGGLFMTLAFGPGGLSIDARRSGSSPRVEPATKA